MVQISLTDYLQTKMFFQLFDALLKEELINKDYYLESIGISPSSYRRAKNEEQKVGLQIVQTLSEKFNLKITPIEVLDNLEDMCNDIYFDMYYKIYDRYELYLAEIEKLLEQNYNVYPIFKLLKLFLLINAPKFSDELYQNYLDLFNEVKKYKNFYNPSLRGIYNLFILTFESNSIDYNLAKELYGGFSYYVASFRSWKDKKYTECLYYADKAKDILVKESNYKRISNLNFNIMSSLIYLNCFEECFELAFNQMLMLESFAFQKSETKRTMKYLLPAAIGIGKYEFVVKKLKDLDTMSQVEIVCYMISLSQLSFKDYDSFYQENFKSQQSNDIVASILKNTNNYIFSPNKDNLQKLDEFSSLKYIVHVLKSCKL